MFWAESRASLDRLNRGIAFAIGDRDRFGEVAMPNIWNWFNCHVSGRHEYGVFLRCVHCGGRSSASDAIKATAGNAKSVAPRVTREKAAAPAPVLRMPVTTARILPFTPRASGYRPAA